MINIGGRHFYGPYSLSEWVPPIESGIYAILSGTGVIVSQDELLYIGMSRNFADAESVNCIMLIVRGLKIPSPAAICSWQFIRCRMRVSFAGARRREADQIDESHLQPTTLADYAGVVPIKHVVTPSRVESL
jgi:hypothetical protein